MQKHILPKIHTHTRGVSLTENISFHIKFYSERTRRALTMREYMLAQMSN